MRIFISPIEAVKEVERDLFEMGIDVHPQTMQDKVVGDDEDYATKEIRAYGYKLTKYRWEAKDETSVLKYLFKDDHREVSNYINVEHKERWSGEMLNPGTAWLERQAVWSQFLSENRKFHYTYSERFACQTHMVLNELKHRPDTRQAIITVHSNVNAFNSGLGANIVEPSQDYRYTGGHGRIPCSMYYQFMRREGFIDLIYTMRSCDFLTHFPVDLMLALRAQAHVAEELGLQVGDFTHFMGSLHAYKKDMVSRGIF